MEELAVSTRLTKLEDTIVKCYSNHNKTMATLASVLTVIDDDKLYLERGAKSTAAYAYERYGISKSSVSEAIAIMHRFGVREGDKYKVLPEMQEYSYTQLRLIRRIPEEYQLPGPEVSTRELEAFLKSLKDTTPSNELEEEGMVAAEEREAAESENAAADWSTTGENGITTATKSFNPTKGFAFYDELRIVVLKQMGIDIVNANNITITVDYKED